MKKLFSVLLAGALLLGALFCVSVSAEEEGDFAYEIRDGEAIITDYIGEGGEVVTPTTLGGCPVVEIGDNAFAEKENVTGVTISYGVRRIGSYAFAFCYDLTRVEIPDSVVSTGYFPFSGNGGVDHELHLYIWATEVPEGWDYLWYDGCMSVKHFGYVPPERQEPSEEPSDEPESSDEPSDVPSEDPEPSGDPETPEEPETTGDVNDDGEINSVDYMLLKRAVLGSFELTEAQRAVADINHDGEINSVDYMLLKRAVLGTYVIGQ